MSENGDRPHDFTELLTHFDIEPQVEPAKPHEAKGPRYHFCGCTAPSPGSRGR